MQFVRYRHGSGSSQWGYKTDDTVYVLADVPGEESTLTAIANPSYRQRVRRLAAAGELSTLEASAITILAPVGQPGKLIALGLNYRDHAEEQDTDIPERPLLFGKAPTSVTHPDRPIVYPDAIDRLDYEVELGIVIGRTARRVDADEATEYVAGYTVLNDVSARDAQFEDKQWFRGKSYDTFAPMGPTLATGPEFEPNDRVVRLRVNGETKQESNTDQLIFGPGDVIEYTSRVMTLQPGDVISTGTPGGVGVFRDPPELLEPGDTVEAEIEGIGTLRNSVVDEPTLK